MNELDIIKKEAVIDKNFNPWFDQLERANFTRPCPFIVINRIARFQPEPFPDELDAEVIPVKLGITNEIT